MLTPLYENKSVIFVPVENAILGARMRHILSASELYAFMRSMPDEQGIWIEK